MSVWPHLGDEAPIVRHKVDEWPPLLLVLLKRLSWQASKSGHTSLLEKGKVVFLSDFVWAPAQYGWSVVLV